MAHYNTGAEVQVGDDVSLDGWPAIVTGVLAGGETGNEGLVTVEVTCAARLLEQDRST
jgi:hypothetical protein